MSQIRAVYSGVYSVHLINNNRKGNVLVLRYTELLHAHCNCTHVYEERGSNFLVKSKGTVSTHCLKVSVLDAVKFNAVWIC